VPLVLKTAPSAILPLADAKTHLRVSGTADDAYITALIAAATGAVETETGRALGEQTWIEYLDAFPYGREIRLQRPPLKSVTAVKYYDGDNVEQTLAASKYTVHAQNEPARVELNDGETWPTTYARRNAVSVEFVAGYATIPEALLFAVKFLIAHFYVNRVPVSDRQAVQVPKTFEYLVGAYKVYYP